MTTGQKVKHGILAAACFVGPIYLLTGGSKMISESGWSSAHSVLGWLFAAGIAWVLLELWKSSLSSDEKLYWTVLALILMPVVLPYFWYSHISGLRPIPPNKSAQHNAGSRPSSDDLPASETTSSLGPRG